MKKNIFATKNKTKQKFIFYIELIYKVGNGS